MRWIPILFALVAAAMLWTSSCDRNVEHFVPGEKPAVPDLSKIFPAPEAPGETGSQVMASMPDARAPGVQPMAGRRGNTEASVASSIRGFVQLAPEIQQYAPADAILFVIARRNGAAGGPPLAVRRFVEPRFPVEFEVGPEHVMVPGQAFDGEIRLSARLDSDGNAMTRLPGDLQGNLNGSVSPGARDIAIVLNERL